MKTLISTLFILLLFTIVHVEQAISQVQNEANISSSEMRSMLNSNQIPLHRATNTEGSPYYFEDFFEGVVHLKNGFSTRPLQIRYNTHTQSVDFMSGNLAFNVEGDNIDSFTFSDGENEYKFSKGYEARGISEDDFVEVAAEGEATFIVRHYTNFFEDASTYGQATQEDRYVTSAVFYLKVDDDDFNRIRRPNERRIMRNFDRFEDELETFANQHSLDFSDVRDVARLVKYYNSLAE